MFPEGMVKRETKIEKTVNETIYLFLGHLHRLWRRERFYHNN